MFEPMIPADAVAHAEGAPFSPRYDDVYHPAHGALARARHVFLAGNGLPARWRARAEFTVVETGFGIGLNFLALWDAWRSDPSRPARLEVVSIEAHPFERAALRAWLARVVPDSMRALADELADAWPPLVPGLHRLELASGAVGLTLGFGRAQGLVPRLTVAADAFFLDGFAPERNPEVWDEPLIVELGRRASAAATAATWTSAQQVRRALAAAGFAVESRPGFPAGTAMTVGFRVEPGAVAAVASARRQAPSRAVVIGAGIAGAGVADALARRGWMVSVVDPALAHGGAHAGHAAAAATPQADRDDSVRARLSRAGVLRATARWHGVAEDGVVDGCGTVQVAPARRAAKADDLAAWQAGLAGLSFPADWLRTVDVEEASALAGVPVGRGGVWLSGGLLVRPDLLVERLLARAAAVPVAARAAAIVRDADGWRVLDADGACVARSELLVLACAGATAGLLAASGIDWPLANRLAAVAGQVSVVPSASLPGNGPRCIVAGDGYLLPAVSGGCVLGSTYDHALPPGAQPRVTLHGHAANLVHLRALLREAPAADPAAWRGWAGWRAVLPGRQPAIGPLPGAPGLWLATGYASRGLTWSALAGDAIAGALAGEAPVLEDDLAAAVEPCRPGR